MGEAYITRRGGSSGGVKGVSGIASRTSMREISIPDLAGKTCFAIVARDYGVIIAGSTQMIVTAIYYNNGSYSVWLMGASGLFEFTGTDDFDILAFNNSTGKITLENALQETIMFETYDYHYVGW